MLLDEFVLFVLLDEFVLLEVFVLSAELWQFLAFFPDAELELLFPL